MANTTIRICLVVLGLIVLPLSAAAIEESKSGFEYPDEVTVGEGEESVTLAVTGVGLREKTFMKVDVYTIVSYVAQGVVLEGEDKGVALMEAREPKRIQMDLRRGFSCEKLLNAFTDVIDKNFEDQTAFAEDLTAFMAYFDRDAQEGDVITFDFCPENGLYTSLNGEQKGVIDNFEFARALWSVWFGEKPANDGLKEKLLAALD